MGTERAYLPPYLLRHVGGSRACYLLLLLLLLYKCCLSCYTEQRGDTDTDTLSENFQVVAVITTTTAVTITKYCLTTFYCGFGF